MVAFGPEALMHIVLAAGQYMLTCRIAETFDVEFVAGSWTRAMKELFGEGGEFDRIYQPAATN